MPMDEVIRAIEQCDAENIQDVMQAAMKRYKELYPNWRMLFLSADPNATDKHSREPLAWICRADDVVAKS